MVNFLEDSWGHIKEIDIAQNLKAKDSGGRSGLCHLMISLYMVESKTGYILGEKIPRLDHI